MIGFPDDGLFYHGSYTEVKDIDLGMCRPGLDFGRGFYLTTSYGQAMDFVGKSIGKAKNQGIIPDSYLESDGRVSVFMYQQDPKLSIKCFTEADIDWLHFVACNRNGSLFPELKEKYAYTDIIYGKIANDQTARTLNNYVVGIYGEPGNERTDQFVIDLLKPNKLENQFCFRTEKAVKALSFIRSDAYESNK